MRVADITAEQIASYLEKYRSESLAMTSRPPCKYCDLLTDAFFKSGVGMDFTVRAALANVDVFSVITGFHIALEMLQSVQEAEELETLMEDGRG